MPVAGQVIETVGGVYRVRTADGVVEASLRGRVKHVRGARGKVVIGDRVDVLAAPATRADHAWVIQRVGPRATRLVRRALGGRVAKVVAANLDRLLVVASVADPPPSAHAIDRMLVMGESGGMEGRVVLNKMDLHGADGVARQMAPRYRRAGYPVLMTSAVSGRGIEDLRRLLRGGSSALAGPSGVGKSSLLNAVEPLLALRTRRVGRRSRSGKHTTVSSRLIALAGGGHVADTPGFSDVGLGDVESATLDRCFPEFRPFLGRCRFSDCRHLEEPGCCVHEAVGRGHVQRGRYESYEAIFRELP